MVKDTQILVIVAAGLVLLFALKKNGGGQKITENYSAAEGWLSGMGNFHNTLNDSVNRNINNATDQVIKVGDAVQNWRLQRFNNGSSKWRY